MNDLQIGISDDYAVARWEGGLAYSGYEYGFQVESKRLYISMTYNPLYKYCMKGGPGGTWGAFADQTEADRYGGLYYRDTFDNLIARKQELIDGSFGKPIILRAMWNCPKAWDAIPDEIPHTDIAEEEGSVWRWLDLRDERAWSWLHYQYSRLYARLDTNVYGWQLGALGKWQEHNQNNAPAYYKGSLNEWYAKVIDYQTYCTDGVVDIGVDIGKFLMNIGAPTSACIDAWTRGVRGAYQDNTGEETWDSAWKDKIPPQYRDQVVCRFGEASWKGVSIDWQTKQIPPTTFDDFFSAPWLGTIFGNMAEGYGIWAAPPPYPAHYKAGVEACQDYAPDRMSRFGAESPEPSPNGPEPITLTYPEGSKAYKRVSDGSEYGQGIRLDDNPATVTAEFVWISVWVPMEMSVGFNVQADDYRETSGGKEWFWEGLKEDLHVWNGGEELKERVAALEHDLEGLSKEVDELKETLRSV